MPARRPFPVPKKRLHKRGWEVYWYWNMKRYHVQVANLTAADEVPVEIARVRIAAALASPDPDFPDEYMNTPGVLAYLADRSTPDAPTIQEPPEKWLVSYRKNIYQNCRETWAGNSMSFLQRLQTAAGGNLAKVTKGVASQFLESVQEGNKPATRNRALTVCNRFYKWVISTGRGRANPFTGIKQVKEVRPSEIVYCTRSERERIIEVAKRLRPEDWLAVAIAFYTGCRRARFSV